MFFVELISPNGIAVKDTSDGVSEIVTSDYLCDIKERYGIEVEGFDYSSRKPLDFNYIILVAGCIITKAGIVKFGVFNYNTGVLSYKTVDEIKCISYPIKNIEYIDVCLRDLTKYAWTNFPDRERYILFKEYKNLKPINKTYYGDFAQASSMLEVISPYMLRGYLVASKQLDGSWSVLSTRSMVENYFRKVIEEESKGYSYTFIRSWQYREDSVNKVLYCEILSYDHPSGGSMW